MASEMTNFYKVLGVAPNATPKDINNAYKRLALKHHPDKVSGGDIDEFHKIQEAAETLRDPDRRRRHDYDIKAFRIRNYYKVFGQSLSRNASANANASASASANVSASYTSPNNYNSYNYGYSQHPQPQPQTQRQFYSKWMPEAFESHNMNTSGYTYMYSYKHSVHMSPMSKESTEEQDRYTRDRNRDEEIRRNMAQQTGTGTGTGTGKDSSSSRLAAKVRLQEAMRARLARDEELKNEEGEGEEGAGDQDDEHGVQGVEVGSEGEGEGEGESVREGGPVAEDHECQEGNKSRRPDSSLFGQSEYNTAREESSSDEDEPTPEDAVFYDCVDVESSYLSDTSDVSEASEASDDSEDEDSENESQPMAAFIPHFTAKLNDPSGKYTEKDLRVELHGMMLESYSVWLEEVRLSFSNAQPAPSARDNDPETCLHLGHWEKEFEVPECLGCRRWRPIYTLTCPGCGVSRCVGCKFASKE